MRPDELRATGESRRGGGGGGGGGDVRTPGGWNSMEGTNTSGLVAKESKNSHYSKANTHG